MDCKIKTQLNGKYCTHTCTVRAHMKISEIFNIYCLCNAFLMKRNADFTLQRESNLLYTVSNN